MHDHQWKTNELGTTLAQLRLKTRKISFCPPGGTKLKIYLLKMNLTSPVSHFHLLPPFQFLPSGRPGASVISARVVLSATGPESGVGSATLPSHSPLSTTVRAQPLKLKHAHSLDFAKVYKRDLPGLMCWES